MSLEGVNGILNVESAALHAPQVGVANTNPQHILSVGSNLYVSGDSPDVLTVDGNVVCEGVKVGLIEIIPSYDLEAVANVGNSTSNTIRFTNPDTGIVATGNVSVGKDLNVTGNLNVLGTTTTIDTENLRVKDPIIELGKDNAGTGDLGLVMTRPSGSSNVAVIFDEDTDTLEIGYTQNNASDTDITMDSTPLSVNVNGDLSVTSNVGVGGELTVSGNLEVSGNVSDLNVVSNVNMLHTSNTASIKLNSNVVTEFPRSKKLIKYPRVAMTSDNQPTGYVASASTALGSGWEPYEAFNNIAGEEDGWHDVGSTYSAGVYIGSNSVTPVTGGDVEGEWIQIQLPEKIKLEKVRLAPRSTYIDRMPKDATILGSINGTDWYSVASWSGQTYLSGKNYATIDIDSEQYYNYYVLVVEALDGGNSANIGEWELYGTPEYDPEAHGVDVVVKSVPNVPNTDWLEVYYDAKNYTSGLVQDLSTNSFNGTLTNGASFNNSDGIDKFVFDGSNDYISGSIPSTFTGNQTYTFSIWVKPDSHPSSGFVGVFEVGTRSSNDSMGLYFDTGKIIHLAYGDNLATTTVATIGHWVHITGTYTSGDRRVYANGNLLKQDDYSGLTLVGTTFKLGSNEAGTQAFNGSIANFRLFNRALTPDEIYQLYAYQKEDFGHGDLGMTLKAGRLGIGTSEPRAMLDVRGGIYANGGQSWPIPCAIFSNVTPSNTGSTYYENNIGTIEVNYNNISLEDPSGTIQASVGSPNITLNRVGMYEFHTESSLKLQSGAGSSHIGHAIIGAGVSGSGSLFESGGYELVTTTYNTVKLVNRTSKVLVTNAPYVVKYQLQPIANFTDRFIELAYGSNNEIHSVAVKYLG